MGARVPIMLTSRSDPEASRLTLLHARHPCQPAQARQISAMSAARLLTLNAGSSTLKFAVYELPRDLIAAGVLAYGFHGLSYDYIASVLRAQDGPRAGGRAIVLHLGSGVSLCAACSPRTMEPCPARS